MTTALLNRQVIDRFRTIVNNDRLAHAYLFIGPKGIGKLETALGVAKLVNHEESLEGDSFLESVVAQKIDGGNHPDVHIVEGQQGEAIKIDDIRDVTQRLQLRAFEAKTKVIIIRNIEWLTLESSNALLKTLEEPAKNSLMILTTSVPEMNLDTIKSRCQFVYFFPLGNDVLFEQLTDESLPVHEKRLCAAFAEGSLGKAQQLIEDNFPQWKNEVIDQFFFNADVEGYIKKLVADKDETKKALDVLLSFVRDLMMAQSGATEFIMHQDRVADIQTLSERLSFDELRMATKEIIKTTKQLRDNLNVKMSFQLIKVALSR